MASRDPIRYLSTRGEIESVGFDRAVLQGVAADGGLFVPDRLPLFSHEKLRKMQHLDYPRLCQHILSEFIDPAIIPRAQLYRLITESFSQFSHPDMLPIVPLQGRLPLYIMELFHGPTLSFKDIAMGLLVRIMDHLLARSNRRLNLVLATTGDTGPAAAHAAAGLAAIHCWPLFPRGMITGEQEMQMTGIMAENIHPVGVTGCLDGGDDLDRVVLALFNDTAKKQRLSLSSVNSINWCRVMVQTVHYFYAYFSVCRAGGCAVGDPIDFSVPSGAFGNLFAGYMAREMGLPVGRFVCAVNANQTLYRAFNQGVFQPGRLISTCSSAIDIVLPYNFWRFLYFVSGRRPSAIRGWMDALEQGGRVELDPRTHKAITHGFAAVSVSDDQTLSTIKEVFNSPQAYLLDPHGAVAVSAANSFRRTTNPGTRRPMVCLATAHPAKFPGVTARALDLSLDSDDQNALPEQARHPALRRPRETRANLTLSSLEHLEDFLTADIESTQADGLGQTNHP